jgi:hypothetical protein
MKLWAWVREIAYREVREVMLPQAYVPIHRLATAPANVAPLPAGTLQPMRDEVIPCAQPVKIRYRWRNCCSAR